MCIFCQVKQKHNNLDIKVAKDKNDSVIFFASPFKSQCGRTALHFAFDNGQSEVAKMLIQKSREFNIDLNAKG